MCSPGRTHDPSLSRRTFLLRNNEYQYQCRAAAKERERKRGKSAVFESPAIIDCLRKEEGRFERYPPVDQPKEISKRRTYRRSSRGHDDFRRNYEQRRRRWNRSKGKCKWNLENIKLCSLQLLSLWKLIDRLVSCKNYTRFACQFYCSIRMHFTSL